MQARMKNPVMVLPAAMQAIHALGQSTDDVDIPVKTLHLMHLRASQINGCGVCVDLHPRLALKDGETAERLFAVAAWRESPYFTDEERAALALTEAVTRLADRPDPVPDEVWDAAADLYTEEQLAALIVQIATINVWNRINASVKQVAGAAVL
ncbi:carboxymuconolactone decarboxylase family protein [Rhodococcus sp. NPDC003382]|uniref:carboxymuconolactone decarboxylase family protein n=1 Tax=Rhodococcus sp. CX TaxID=2789880 RepID=UPI0018CFDB8D|nr:carboxymuconolactone decarboxylase family protein [Rhodococcus sp. CX]MBH0121694.1 carboxymuconolactone decarboxylase family protein [Rhodococcus sp. CX]